MFLTSDGMKIVFPGPSGLVVITAAGNAGNEELQECSGMMIGQKPSMAVSAMVEPKDRPPWSSMPLKEVRLHIA